METINISGYKFVGVPDPASWKAPLQEKCAEFNLKGTLILAPEGINVALAGSQGDIDSLLKFLREDGLFRGRFSDLEVKVSASPNQPFKKMLVRIEKEIITMRQPISCLDVKRAPAVSAARLKQWLDKGVDDDGREVVLIDTRNDYEVEMGTFEGSIRLGIDVFHKFPEALASIAPGKLSDKAVVSFCTGGIRCEKAVLYMQNSGYENVYQLDGGILKYFEEVGGAHWKGDCFVFDQRVGLDPNLNEIDKPDGWLTELHRREGQTP